MSITKRRLEIMEWIEGIQDRLLDDRISQPIARHLLRKLPSDIHLLWITASAPQDGFHQDGSSAPSPRNYDKHEAEVLQKLRYTLTSVCMARLTDPDLEDLYFSQGYERAEMALGDHDAISADAFTLKGEIEASQDAFPDIAMNFDEITLFGSGVKGALNDAGELFTAVEHWRRYSHGKAYWSFWREWYQGFLNGKPMDWELQRRVALIPDEDWEKGPEHIARVIEDIRRDFEAEREATAVPKPEEKPVPAAQAEAMAKRLANNRDAIALTAASVLEQIAEFRERVRGNNQLEPEFREKLLDFLDDLSAQLNALLELLPEDRKAPDEAAGEKGVRWLREFKASFFKEGAAYASPENVAKATIPTGIILGCTGIGSLLGFPGAGGIVGALITSQIKPGKAAEELMKPRTPDAD